MKTNWIAERTKRGGTPTTWILPFGNAKIVITRISTIDAWFFHCYKLAIDERELEAKDIREAKREAVAFVEGVLNRMRRDLREAVSCEE